MTVERQQMSARNHTGYYPAQNIKTEQRSALKSFFFSVETVKLFLMYFLFYG